MFPHWVEFWNARGCPFLLWFCDQVSPASGILVDLLLNDCTECLMVDSGLIVWFHQIPSFLQLFHLLHECLEGLASRFVSTAATCDGFNWC